MENFKSDRVSNGAAAPFGWVQGHGANALVSPGIPERWSPSRRPARHPVRAVPQPLKLGGNLDGLKDPADWTLVSIKAADDLGHVRSGMTYNKDFGTSAGLFEKPRRILFLEGSNEPALADHLEMHPHYLNFQFQPLDMTFCRADGVLVERYVQAGATSAVGKCVTKLDRPAGNAS